MDVAIALAPVLVVLLLSAPGWLGVRRGRRRHREELAALDEIINRRGPS